MGYSLPVICIIISTERQDALDKSCFVLEGIDEKNLLQAVDTAVELNMNENYSISVPDYVEKMYLQR